MEELLRFVDLEKKDIVELYQIRDDGNSLVMKKKRETHQAIIDKSVKHHELIFSIMNLAIIDEVIRTIENKVIVNILEFKHFLN